MCLHIIGITKHRTHEGGKQWSEAARQGRPPTEDDGEDDWTDESENEDPDGELGRLEWIEKTKKDIADAVPHEEKPFWNCSVCGNRCLGTSFVRFPEKRELGMPAACVHVFDCAITFRKQYDFTYDWEINVGEPKEGYDVDGHPIVAPGASVKA